MAILVTSSLPLILQGGRLTARHRNCAGNPETVNPVLVYLRAHTVLQFISTLIATPIPTYSSSLTMNSIAAQNCKLDQLEPDAGLSSRDHGAVSAGKEIFLSDPRLLTYQ